MDLDFGLDSWEDIQIDQLDEIIGNQLPELQQIENLIQMDLIKWVTED